MSRDFVVSSQTVKLKCDAKEGEFRVSKIKYLSEKSLEVKILGSHTWELVISFECVGAICKRCAANFDEGCREVRNISFFDKNNRTE